MNTKNCPPLLSRLMLAFAAIVMAAGLAAMPATAQIQTVDPNDAIGSDTGQSPQTQSQAGFPAENNTTVQDGIPTDGPPADGQPTDNGGTQVGPGDADGVGSPESQAARVPGNGADTYQKDDLIGAAEGVFGKGASGLAGIIEDILEKQGQPNAYIVGREGGGAFVVGLRYGSGTMYHKVEGEKKAYWTGPSIGFDAGANAGSTFILVYNLYDSEDLYKRFPSAEGVAYLVGGFNASYLRRGDVVLIPVRVGAGLRLGANVGYMKFSKKQRWLPF
jgi:hypothetical protein